MNTYTLKSGEYETVVSMDDRHAAFKRFFEQVVENDRLGDIGNVAIVHDGDEKYPMRTVPALYVAGAIGWERVVASIEDATGAGRAEADRLLQDAAEMDAWVVEGVGDDS